MPYLNFLYVHQRSYNSDSCCWFSEAMYYNVITNSASRGNIS